MSECDNCADYQLRLSLAEKVVEAAKKLYDCYPQWPDTDNLGEWSALGHELSAYEDARRKDG